MAIYPGLVAFNSNKLGWDLGNASTYYRCARNHPRGYPQALKLSELLEIADKALGQFV